MSEWIDFIVYACEILALWFVFPTWASRLTVPMLAARNPEWVAANSAEITRISHNRFFVNASYVWGTLSFAVLLIVRLGMQPHSLQPLALHTPSWVVLNTTNSLLLMLGLAGYAVCVALALRWLSRTVPPGERRTATLRPRAVADSVPGWIAALVHMISGAVTVAWIVIGVLGLNRRPQYWWGFAFFLTMTVLFAWLSLGMAWRPASYLDQKFGTVYRRTQVRVGLLLQLCVAAFGALALYHELTRVDSRRLSGLAVALFVTFTILTFARLRDERRPPAAEEPKTRVSAHMPVLALALLSCFGGAPSSQALGISTVAPSTKCIDDGQLIIHLESADVTAGRATTLMLPRRSPASTRISEWTALRRTEGHLERRPMAVCGHFVDLTQGQELGFEHP
jgi:hypothetical protein